MRAFTLIPLILLNAVTARAEEHAQAYPPVAPASTPQQISGNYYSEKYAPQAGYAAQPAAPVAIQPYHAPQVATPQPSDYGQSVMTDIRQMNF